MSVPKCWCDRNTQVWSSRSSPDRGVTDTAHAEVRICLEHGEWWHEDPSLTAPPEG